MIQGTQQIYIVALWFWGSRLIAQEINGVVASNLVTYGPGLTGITIPIALIMWTIGLVLFFGLPDYYRQAPGQVPSFYRSIVRRKIIVVSIPTSMTIRTTRLLTKPKVVLHHRPHPKLFPLRSLRPRLEIPLVLAARPCLVHRPSRPRILRWRLGRHPLPLRRPLETPLLDPTHVRRRPRGPALVPNALGDLGHGPLGPVGRVAARGRFGRSDVVAVARGAGCGPGGRVRHDTPSDTDTVPHRVHAGVRAGAWVCGDDRGEGVRAGQRGARVGIPESGAEFPGAREGVVLDRAGDAGRHLRGVFQVLPQGMFVPWAVQSKS